MHWLSMYNAGTPNAATTATIITSSLMTVLLLCYYLPLEITVQ